MQRLIEIGSVVLEKKIFKFRQCTFFIKNYLPLEKGVTLHLNKLEFPSPKAACSIFGVNWPSGSSEEDF